MRKMIALAVLTTFTSLAPQMVTQQLIAGQRNAHHETLMLAGKIDHLRAVVRPRSRIAEESVCRMEEIADRLCDKLSCPHELEPILCAMRDLTSAADSAALTIQRECRLRNDFVIRDSLERVLRQLARVQVAVEELARRTARSPGHGPHHGLNPQAAIPGFSGPEFGSSLPNLPPWMRAELERRSAYSRGYDPYAAGPRYESYGRSSGQLANPLDRFPPQAGNVPRGGSVPHGSVPPLDPRFGATPMGLSAPPIPGASLPASGRPTGRIGQTILSLLLSEALR